ncbi:non-hydrolyzing UDP-N-acetylglucosamine 2-epimerase [Citreimonas sp.]|uniref:non-hydrolyzing UDP-N-acetylglucosamine 2-epimerase n=1 Tax=Citreimonas sp. TaxID=3036715 RepID=UPI004058CFD3
MKLGIVIGTRPEAIKMAPVMLAAQAAPGIEPELIVSGQHRDMVAPILDFFGLTADRDLGAMAGPAGLTPLFSRVALGLDGVFEHSRFDEILVHGDTTTAAAAALSAFHRGVPVGHVEAGLRTHDLTQPFPEEYNRRLGDISARHHFAPTEGAAAALRAEGVAEAGLSVTGNTVVDALFAAVARIDAGPRGAEYAARFRADDRPVVLVTAHRRENFGPGLEALCDAIRRIVAGAACRVIFPVHPNPSVRGPIRAALADLEAVTLLDPLDYPGFVWLMREAALIITDSGGVQEEAPSFGTPVLVMRDKTERPEGVAAGAVELVGAHADRLAERALARLGTEAARVPAPNPYGDGRASARIIDTLLAGAQRGAA